MIFNVAQLLKSPVGSSQTVELDDNDRLELQDGEAELAGPVTGEVRLHRTNQGIYADGTAHVPVKLECTRCLTEFEQTIDVPIQEEFFPTIDVNTGLPVPSPEPENELAFSISRHHEIDMREAIRQNLVVNLPVRALCREDCAGLCPTCGKDLNEGPCDCQPDTTDDRFAPLRDLLEQANGRISE